MEALQVSVRPRPRDLTEDVLCGARDMEDLVRYSPSSGSSGA